MTTLEELIKEYGIYKTNGKRFALIQDPYIDGEIGDAYYHALAIDITNIDVTKYPNEDLDNWDITHDLRWEITHENPEECDDESHMCNWNEFSYREV